MSAAPNKKPSVALGLILILLLLAAVVFGGMWVVQAAFTPRMSDARAAAEAASACREYAFNVPGFNEIYSIIRDNNIPSQNVAKRNGMTPAGTFVKHYYGMDMPHILYKAERK